MAFAIWGVFPLYFTLLHRVPALQVIAHRIVWSCLFVLVWIAVRRELHTVRETLTDAPALRRLALSAMLISVNWFIYVWAVMNGHVVETSLGYFIGPLVNVSLGVALLSERLTAAQWVAIALAAAGVLYLAVIVGQVAWIALALAIPFACYGLVRKVVKVASLPGLAVETLVLMPFAALYLAWCAFGGGGALGHDGPAVDALLIGSGPLTAVTLFLFAYGTRLLPYATVGVIQYIAPTLQFICGVYVLHEPFNRPRAVGFTIIWTALIIYAASSWQRSRRAA